MYYQGLSDDDILKGFRNGDASIIREYFYGYCKAGYIVFDQRYQLSEKENLDFMSLAHQYALYLMEHDWKPLEDHSPNVSLRTWLINGFRYVVLDALKWHKKEYGSITFLDYLQSFDVTSDLRLQFNRIIIDMCDHIPMSTQDKGIILMILLKGYKGKEVAEKMHLTPAAISIRYKKLKDDLVVPYLQKHFDMNLDMPEVMPYEDSGLRRSSIREGVSLNESGIDFSTILDKDLEVKPKPQKRTTPWNITALQPNEIFVFGSNLKGIHGGGAALTAYKKFGAIWGEGVGLHGQSYGIPTMQGGVETIRPYVDEFVEYAKAHQNLTFLVTRIGCGIAGFTDDDISPLLKKAKGIDNVILPKWW